MRMVRNWSGWRWLGRMGEFRWLKTARIIARKKYKDPGKACKNG
jgi:hypothetical protein